MKEIPRHKLDSHLARSSKRWDRVTKKTNYKNAEGKTLSSSGREDLFWSQKGDTPSQRKSKAKAHMAKKMPLSEEAKNFIARNKITPEMRKKTFDRIQRDRIKSGN